MTFQVYDNNKWIKDLLDLYDNKELSREKLIEEISSAGFDAYKMGYEQKEEDLANDESISNSEKLFKAPGETGEFDEPKQEWFKPNVDLYVEGETSISLPGVKVREGTTRQGIGVNSGGGFHCTCDICDGLVPGRTSCIEGIDKI